MLYRRLAVTALLAAPLLPHLAQAEAPAGYYTDQRVVYQNSGPPMGASDSQHIEWFQHLLGSLHNHVVAVGKTHVQIRVVDFGGGVDLLILAKMMPDVARKIDSLRQDGVRFLVCANTLKGRNIKPGQLYKVSKEDVVPSGVAELSRLQGMGFSYIRY